MEEENLTILLLMDWTIICLTLFEGVTIVEMIQSLSIFFLHVHSKIEVMKKEMRLKESKYMLQQLIYNLKFYSINFF